jgi:hypothetical protein
MRLRNEELKKSFSEWATQVAGDFAATRRFCSATFETDYVCDAVMWPPSGGPQF